MLGCMCRRESMGASGAHSTPHTLPLRWNGGSALTSTSISRSARASSPAVFSPSSRAAARSAFSAETCLLSLAFCSSRNSLPPAVTRVSSFFTYAFSSPYFSVKPCRSLRAIASSRCTRSSSRRSRSWSRAPAVRDATTSSILRSLSSSKRRRRTISLSLPVSSRLRFSLAIRRLATPLSTPARPAISRCGRADTANGDAGQAGTASLPPRAPTRDGSSDLRDQRGCGC